MFGGGGGEPAKSPSEYGTGARWYDAKSRNRKSRIENMSAPLARASDRFRVGTVRVYIVDVLYYAPAIDRSSLIDVVVGCENSREFREYETRVGVFFSHHIWKFYKTPFAGRGSSENRDCVEPRGDTRFS